MVMHLLVPLSTLLFFFSLASAEAANITQCQRQCGNISIPYPFGIREDDESCYFGEPFRLTCNLTAQPTPTTVWGKNIQVLHIDLLQAQISFNIQASYDCHYPSGPTNKFFNYMNLDRGAPFTFSETRTRFTAIGCDTVALLNGSWGIQFGSGCISLCTDYRTLTDGSCSGVGCCQTSIPRGVKKFDISIYSFTNHTNINFSNPCSFAFLVDQDHYNFSRSDLIFEKSNDFYYEKKSFPVVIDWAVAHALCDLAPSLKDYACRSENSRCMNSINGLGYICNCSQGFAGNPYIPGGCTDINECLDPRANHCLDNAVCVNYKGSYKCKCPDGFSGDGTKGRSGCTDIDECLEPHANSCVPNAKCFNYNRGYGCKCPDGFSGDGKLSGSGCTRNKNNKMLVLLLISGLIVLILLLVSILTVWGLQRRKLQKLKVIFFHQNGGELLERLASSNGGVELMKIFTEEELKNATNNFHENQIVGEGGYGTVYKATLSDHRTVAIKKSKIVDKSQIEQFINEIIILYRMNHTHVVRLLGCCLETQAPMLVYEFISNGTLFQHIHGEGHSSISLQNRLRIAAETARALAYLHFEATIQIVHRDVKTQNILLDNDFHAKVSDFGASRLVSLDQTQMSTLVQGTLGYLDPEYFHSGQLTEKSDVYSFGVVLVELLTGKQPISNTRSPEERSLIKYFISAMENNRLFQVLEDRVVTEGGIDQLVAVAQLARRCLMIKGEERPSMREVASELEGLRGVQQHPWIPHNQEETTSLLGGFESSGVTGGDDSMHVDKIGALEIGR